MSRSNYKDAYISRDTNGAFGADFGDARFFAASTADKPLLSLDGGITMDAHAELGMKIEGTPFAAQKPPIGVNKPDSMKADPPVGGFPITHDANLYPINDRAAFAADGVLNTMNIKIMTGVKQYWGIGLVIASLVGAGYYLGRKK